ncbi:MAG TPA: alpha-amylase family glycosyl hydrolase, partial [Turneriella sp.]|nr:alpha-amylase family glycosyl hydrolase [Turneriella sp.]
MLFPVTGFPVPKNFQKSIPTHAGRIHLTSFQDAEQSAWRISKKTDALFLTKAAHLSKLLYRILKKVSIQPSMSSEQYLSAAHSFAIPEASVGFPFCGLYFLSIHNPTLLPLHPTLVVEKSAAVIGALDGDTTLERLLKLLNDNPTSIDAQIQALLKAHADFFTDEEKSHFLQIVHYTAGAKTQANAAPLYGYDAPVGAPQLRSHDKAWMQSLVLIAKIVPVWLVDIRRRYGIDARRLDDVPDAELVHLKSFGVNGIWLVGLWQRSAASARIKNLSGGKNYASAYSIFDYRVADEWGGEDALEQFYHRCARHGIRLGCDMVPNHTGIDSKWLRENPDWFMQVEESPFPNYRFSGENLSADAPMEIRIEDGYYTHRDAAVVFEYKKNNRTRYIYHGNDGTGLPWNDTAQLDHTRADVRQVIIDTALSLTRYFSVIRFDAAMTLTREHYHRLWFPPPSAPPAIPSRSAATLSAQDFSAQMPREFWADLVEAFRKKSPETLLIAEAFWMTEMFFVRNLGMHRVYNSAFMHALRDEKNHEFQKTLTTFREHDEGTLTRFVNYLSTPDEEAARAH